MAEHRFRKGDPVEFEFGTRLIRGSIKEDRGPIGVQGRHLYGVEFLMGSEDLELSVIELPAMDLKAVRAGESARSKKSVRESVRQRLNG